MSRYRRARSAGACYFFTVVTYRRQPILCDDAVRQALRDILIRVRETRPFTIDAWVLLPDHLHCIRTLPSGAADYSMRWNRIKRWVSMVCARGYKRPDWMSASKRKHRESTVWQRRFWEHQIRDDLDFMRHVDYLHYNPVKHGVCQRVADWPHSTFHQYVVHAVYPVDWSGVDGGVMTGE
jgi:putative transposase